MIHPVRGERVGWENRIVEAEKGVGFFSNTIVRTLIGVALLFVVTSSGIFMYFVRPSGTLRILHYNVYFGVDLLGAWWQVYIFPLFSLLFFVGHLMLARYFYQRAERIAAYLLLLASVLIGLGILIASVSIAFINY